MMHNMWQYSLLYILAMKHLLNNEIKNACKLSISVAKRPINQSINAYSYLYYLYKYLMTVYRDNSR